MINDPYGGPDGGVQFYSGFILRILFRFEGRTMLIRVRVRVRVRVSYSGLRVDLCL